MTGRSSVSKGARGEAEFAQLLRDHGVEAGRTGHFQRGGSYRVADLYVGRPFQHFAWEIKRRRDGYKALYDAINRQ